MYCFCNDVVLWELQYHATRAFISKLLAASVVRL